MHSHMLVGFKTSLHPQDDDGACPTCPHLYLLGPEASAAPRRNLAWATVTGQSVLTQRYECHEGGKIRIQFIVGSRECSLGTSKEGHSFFGKRLVLPIRLN